MIEYYKDSKDNYYRLICRANDSRDGKEIAILQELNEDGKLLAVPLSEYIRIDNTEKINEVLLNCPIDLNPKYRFPYIEYQKEKPKMRKPGERFSKSVQTMISILTNEDRHIVDKYFFDKLSDDDEIEEKALEKIDNYREGDDIETIFHLIQAWGGSSGRGIYVFKNKSGEKYRWQVIEKPYKELVKACLKANKEDKEYIKKLVSVANTAVGNISNLGVSFITKHIRFWLYKNLREEALPIYDSVMAIEVMHKKEPYITDLEEYWNVMAAKAKREGISLMSLERQIFLHAY